MPTLGHQGASAASQPHPDPSLRAGSAQECDTLLGEPAGPRCQVPGWETASRTEPPGPEARAPACTAHRCHSVSLRVTFTETNQTMCHRPLQTVHFPICHFGLICGFLSPSGRHSFQTTRCKAPPPAPAPSRLFAPFAVSLRNRPSQGNGAECVAFSPRGLCPPEVTE